MAADAVFFYVYGTAIVLVESLLGVAFALRALAQSSRRMAYLAIAYAWSAPLAVLNVLALPGIIFDREPGHLQVAPAAWILWHLGWPLAIGAYAFVREGPGRRSSRIVPMVLGASFLAGGALLWAGPSLPPFLAADDRLQPPFLAAIAISLLLDLAIVVQLARTVKTARDGAVLVAVAFAAIDTALMLNAGVRFSLTYYAARIAGLCSAFAMLSALVFDGLAVIRHVAQQAADRDRLSEFRTIADAMPQIVWQMTADGENRYANARWSEYTGHDRPDGRDPTFTHAIHPDDRTARNATFAAARASGGVYEATYRLRGADGRYRYFLSRAVPVVRDGAIVSWVGTSTDIDERKRIEELQRAAFDREVRDAGRLRVLATLGRGLAESLELEVVLRTAVSVPVPAIADWILLNLYNEDGQLVVAATQHRDPERSGALRRLIGTSYVVPSGHGGSVDAAAESKAVLAADVSETMLRDTIKPEWLDLITGLEPRSSVVVPLHTGATVRGTLNFVHAESRRRYDVDDLELLEEIGRRVALAIENAEHFTREHRVADRLQRASLPSSLPNAPGVVLDAVYQAGRAEALIGGDWYDAFPLDDGRLVIGVGDVMGSGLEAAVTMSSVRQAIRGAAEVSADPVTILDAADRALEKTQPGRIVTAFVGVLDPASGQLIYASAGHPPPFVRGAGGTVHALVGHGLPIGLRRERRAPEDARRVVLDDDSLLVLYTDGLTEAERDVDAGEARLRAVLAANVDNDYPAEPIRRGVLGMGPSLESRDDIAILTVRLMAARQSGVATYRCDVRAAAAAGRVRRAVMDTLERTGLSDAALFRAELVLGELLANVARHAPPFAEVRIATNGKAPRLSVCDRGPGAVAIPDLPHQDAESGRGLFLVANLVDALDVIDRPGGGTEIAVTLWDGDREPQGVR